MLIKFRCPHCQTALEATSNFAGKDGDCPKCAKKITVPKNDSGGQTEPQEAAKKD